MKTEIIAFVGLLAFVYALGGTYVLIACAGLLAFVYAFGGAPMFIQALKDRRCRNCGAWNQWRQHTTPPVTCSLCDGQGRESLDDSYTSGYHDGGSGYTRTCWGCSGLGNIVGVYRICDACGHREPGHLGGYFPEY